MKLCLYKLTYVLILMLAFAATIFAVFAVSGSNMEKAAADTDLKDNQRVLSVIMYHQVLKSRKSSYIVSPETFEKDMDELVKRGFTAVFASDVIGFVNGENDLPKKPIIITFDDGHYNNLYYCGEILKQKNLKAVENIIGAFSEFSDSSGDHSNVNYSHLTWQQIADMDKSGVFEIGNHTYNMHKYSPRKGIKQKKGETDAEYEKNLTADVLRLQQKLTVDSGVTPQVFAYPFGVYSKTSKDILVKNGFKMIFNCYEKRNLITKGDKECLYNVCRFNRDSKYSSRDFFDRIEKSKI